MSRHPTPLTSDQVKERFRRRGETIPDWAKAHGYSRQDVYRVLNGQLKAQFARAHEIAVALGLKVPDADESSAASARRNRQSAKAA